MITFGSSTCIFSPGKYTLLPTGLWLLSKTNSSKSAALQPLYGQLADLWGRRYVMIGATAIFLLGSGLCGGSTSMNMLIWSRAVQGIGAGGINMLIDMIICDLVPMRERGNFIGLLFLFVSLGATIGPFVGGILTDRVSWRWVCHTKRLSPTPTPA